MVQEIKIRCKNNKKTLQLPIGSTLWDAYHALNLQMPYGPVSAKVNNTVEGLHYRSYNDKDVEFLDVTSSSGMRTYTRSLFFVLVQAANGNVNAAKFLRDTAGQNPTQQLQEKEFAYRKKQDREAQKAEEGFGADGGTPVEIYLPEKEDEDDE